eukprot:TRINITY_DN6831_c0_g1_i1.p1 TRINITY_DN6831_c0_g1~~TRINITY_DN6831_c0_g1_i1.p1  ORF type:complete len:1045 (+),score=260.49 TRINITY_DN6831_c0_g1_i1:125-3259(+)
MGEPAQHGEPAPAPSAAQKTTDDEVALAKAATAPAVEGASEDQPGLAEQPDVEQEADAGACKHAVDEGSIVEEVNVAGAAEPKETAETQESSAVHETATVAADVPEQIPQAACVDGRSEELARPVRTSSSEELPPSDDTAELRATSELVPEEPATSSQAHACPDSGDAAESTALAASGSGIASTAATSGEGPTSQNNEEKTAVQTTLQEEEVTDRSAQGKAAAEAGKVTRSPSSSQHIAAGHQSSTCADFAEATQSESQESSCPERASGERTSSAVRHGPEQDWGCSLDITMQAGEDWGCSLDITMQAGEEEEVEDGGPVSSSPLGASSQVAGSRVSPGDALSPCNADAYDRLYQSAKKTADGLQRAVELKEQKKAEQEAAMLSHRRFARRGNEAELLEAGLRLYGDAIERRDRIRQLTEAQEAQLRFQPSRSKTRSYSFRPKQRGDSSDEAAVSPLSSRSALLALSSPHERLYAAALQSRREAEERQKEKACKADRALLQKREGVRFKSQTGFVRLADGVDASQRLYVDDQSRRERRRQLIEKELLHEAEAAASASVHRRLYEEGLPESPQEIFERLHGDALLREGRHFDMQRLSRSASCLATSSKRASSQDSQETDPEEVFERLHQEGAVRDMAIRLAKEAKEIEVQQDLREASVHRSSEKQAIRPGDEAAQLSARLARRSRLSRLAAAGGGFGFGLEQRQHELTFEQTLPLCRCHIPLWPGSERCLRCGVACPPFADDTDQASSDNELATEWRAVSTSDAAGVAIVTKTTERLPDGVGGKQRKRSSGNKGATPRSARSDSASSAARKKEPRIKPTASKPLQRDDSAASDVRDCLDFMPGSEIPLWFEEGWCGEQRKGASVPDRPLTKRSKILDAALTKGQRRRLGTSALISPPEASHAMSFVEAAPDAADDDMLASPFSVASLQSSKSSRSQGSCCSSSSLSRPKLSAKPKPSKGVGKAVQRGLQQSGARRSSSAVAAAKLAPSSPGTAGRITSAAAAAAVLASRKAAAKSSTGKPGHGQAKSTTRGSSTPVVASSRKNNR